MADGDSEPEHPSLELPKLGRRRARTRATDPVVVPADPVEPVGVAEPVEPAPKPSASASPARRGSPAEPREPARVECR